MSRIAAFIFDMDGVLWHSNRTHDVAFRSVLGGIDGYDVSKFDYRRVAGMRTDEAFGLLLREAGVSRSADEIGKLTEKKRLEAREILRQMPPIAPYCREILESLRHRSVLGLATSSSEENVRIFLGASETAGFFSTIVTGEEVSKAKPDPEIYLSSLERLGVTAAEAVVVEDSVGGILSGLNAGLRVAAIVGTESVSTLRSAGATWVMRDLRELEGLP